MLQVLAERYLTALDDTMRQVIQQHLPDEPGFGVMLRYAMGWVNADDTPYSKPTGKRIRPMLLLICNEAAGGNWQQALPAAAAVELLHNFSLIHDDIQDQSETRHNRPTVWQEWGVNLGINAGDALFTASYTALHESSQYLEADQVNHLWKIFNRTNLELTRGQHLDMQFEVRDEVTVDEYISMIKGKSAALLATCAEMGAYIANKDAEIAQQYATFGLNVGISFQIHDDILGIWGNPDVTGKSVATDIVSKKKSLPVLFGLQESAALRSIYEKEQFSDEDVNEAVSLLDSIKAQDYAREQESTYYDKAVEALQATNPDEAVMPQLQGMLDFLFQRDY